MNVVCSMMVATANGIFFIVLVFSCTLFSSTLQYIQEDNGVVPLPCALKTIDRNV
jgi:hypothetical protein